MRLSAWTALTGLSSSSIVKFGGRNCLKLARELFLLSQNDCWRSNAKLLSCKNYRVRAVHKLDVYCYAFLVQLHGGDAAAESEYGSDDGNDDGM